MRPYIWKKTEELSKGFRQRVGLAQALIHDPDILILDEPTSGLDPNQIIEIRKLIRELGKSKTIILSTHILQEVSAVCSRVLIINNGKIAANDTPDNLQKAFATSETISLSVKAGKDEVRSKIAGLGIGSFEQTGSEGDWNHFQIRSTDVNLPEKILTSSQPADGNCGNCTPKKRSLFEDVFLKLTSGESDKSGQAEGGSVI